jgi:hypothetical protein
LLLGDGSVGTGRATAGAEVWAAVEVVVIDAGVLSSRTAPDVMLPEGGGTGPNKLFPELEAAGGGVAAGGVVDGMVDAGGGLVGVVAPEGVTATADGGGDTGGAAAG